MNSKQKGFSLIEVLIVLGIIASVAFITLTKPSNNQKEYRRFFRRFSLMSKNIRNRAMAGNATYRMVFNIQEDRPTQMWVEKTTKKVLLGDEKESRQKFREMLKNAQSKINDQGTKQKKKSDGDFKKAGRFSMDKLKMPPSLNLTEIEIAGIDYKINDGIAAFHYFPHGLVEETVLKFSDKQGDFKASLITDSISGEVYFIPGHKDLRELQDR